MPRVRLTGTLVCRDEAESELVRDHLPAHILRTRAEPGCLRFDVEPTADSSIWRVEELFADEDAFTLHQRNAAVSAWGRATAGIERRYEITVEPTEPRE